MQPVCHLRPVCTPDNPESVSRWRRASTWSPAAEMKICSISVAPMPSIIAKPQACRQLSRVATGRNSPADTLFFRLVKSYSRQRRHLSIKGRCRKAYGRAIMFDRLQQGLGRQFFHQHGRRTYPQRKQQQPTQAERECQRRRSDEDIIRLRTQCGAWEAIAYRQYVAVKMHRAFRHAGSAGGKADQADIFCRGIDCSE